MAKHIWTPGELITARKLNNIEDKIENISNIVDAITGGSSVVIEGDITCTDDGEGNITMEMESDD